MATTYDGWRDRCGGRLVAPPEAVRRTLRPGSTVWVGGWTSVPATLCAAMVEIAPEIAGTRVVTFLSPFDWDRPEILQHLRITTSYVGPTERRAVNEGRIQYVPVARWQAHQLPVGIRMRYDAAFIPISPPDHDGWCSFGGGVWFGQSVRSHAAALVGEIRTDAIRTGGDNRIHVDEFAWLCEAAPVTMAHPVPPRSPETEAAAEVICTLVAQELLHDGATLQMGIGDVSAALPLYLDHLHDIGIHTEIIPGGVAGLVDRGVITGRRKTFHPGKVVGSAFVLLPPEELARVDGDDTFELYDFTYTDDPRNLFQLEDFWAVNNALAVDLTGNVCSESLGTSVFSGPGGQTVFNTVAATTSNGSVIVLPASQLLPGGERVSRIVPTLAAGSTVTVHRALVDYVVTEQGIAHLTGKSLRERVEELLSVSHPDLRGELRREAARLYPI